MIFKAKCSIGVAKSPESADCEFGEVLEFGISGSVEFRVGHFLFAVGLEPMAGDESDGDGDERHGGRQRSEQPE
jgi:hypothetical protein